LTGARAIVAGDEVSHNRLSNGFTEQDPIGSGLWPNAFFGLWLSGVQAAADKKERNYGQKTKGLQKLVHHSLLNNKTGHSRSVRMPRLFSVYSD
jgi:hypothetical protein